MEELLLVGLLWFFAQVLPTVLHSFSKGLESKRHFTWSVTTTLVSLRLEGTTDVSSLLFTRTNNTVSGERGRVGFKKEQKCYFFKRNQMIQIRPAVAFSKQF